jgi:hypothetical protein
MNAELAKGSAAAGGVEVQETRSLSVDGFTADPVESDAIQRASRRAAQVAQLVPGRRRQ